MVYALLYLPLSLHRSLLAETHHFDDSKVLTPAVRSALMEKLCTTDTDLYRSCGWATKVMSARDISSGMLRPAGMYNLNAQAMDATIELIKAVFAQGVNVKEIYIDTIGSPITYQKKLERIFPTVEITVAKKADSLYPCVSAASVCAKVTRDAALDVSYEAYTENTNGDDAAEGWGSGYPSDARCSNWLKRNMDPVFGWGTECRFSWGTAKELLESKNAPLKADWPVEGEDDGLKMTDFLTTAEQDGEGDELVNWYGRKVTEEVF
jgi:ribonuclease H2 subunit A